MNVFPLPALSPRDDHESLHDSLHFWWTYIIFIY